MTPAGDGGLSQVMLDGGVAMPRIGYGVLRIPPATFEQTIRAALDAGYRSIDTATMYGTEALLGRALAQSGRRDEVFLTTKLNNPDHGYAAAYAAFERSRTALQVDVIDLYLIHWPIPRRNLYVETWQALVELRERGDVRVIGVSNFAPEHIARLIGETGVTPAINQIEYHPYFQQPAVTAFHVEQGIVTEAWSPLARGGALLRDERVVAIASRYQQTPAQVVLRWHLQQERVVIPASTDSSHIVDNLDIFGWTLDAEAMEALNALDKGVRLGPDPATFGD
jgi:2,5-diketo-D-gluconate reductase A